MPHPNPRFNGKLIVTFCPNKDGWHSEPYYPYIFIDGELKTDLFLEEVIYYARLNQTLVLIKKEWTCSFCKKRGVK